MYGDAQNDATRTEEWHNFLALKGGALDFGNLTMHPVDLVMIDASKDAWFDLDLVNYQAQVVNGYTRMTPQAGLQIFMPGVNQLPPQSANRKASAQSGSRIAIFRRRRAFPSSNQNKRELWEKRQQFPPLRCVPNDKQEEAS